MKYITFVSKLCDLHWLALLCYSGLESKNKQNTDNIKTLQVCKENGIKSPNVLLYEHVCCMNNFTFLGLLFDKVYIFLYTLGQNSSIDCSFGNGKNFTTKV